MSKDESAANRESSPFEDDDEVRIEGRDLVYPGSRIALERISRVHVDQVSAAATGPIVMSAVGLICLFSMAGDGGEVRAALGAILLGAAGIWWSQKKPTFRLVVHTGDDAFPIFEDKRDERVEAMRAAIAQALAH